MIKEVFCASATHVFSVLTGKEKGNRRENSQLLDSSASCPQLLPPTPFCQAEETMKIVSGGQTGVDRAALDAALECGFSAGGWCPKGRIAEDGIISEKYPLRELDRSGYKARTKQNVLDSDGTAIIYFGILSGGTEQTLLFCIREKKPYVLIDGEIVPFERAVQMIKGFVAQKAISVLNMAGPRASKTPDAYSYTKKVLLLFLKEHV